MILRFLQGLRRRNRDGPTADVDARVAVIRGALSATPRDHYGNFPYPDDPDAVPEWWHLTKEMCALRGFAHASPATRREFERQIRLCESALATDVVALPDMAVAVEPVGTTREQARSDLVGLLRTGQSIECQDALCRRWRMDKGTVSRWITHWEASGIVERIRRGRQVVIRAPASRLARAA